MRSRPRYARDRDPWWWFLAAVVVASLGLALSYGALSPKNFGADERAHSAYADELRHGRLPDIDTLQPSSPYATGSTEGSNNEHNNSDENYISSNDSGDPRNSGEGQGAETAPSGPPRSQDYIYVANHPPAFSAAQGAITAALDGAGLATEATLAVGRVLNALFTAAAMWVLALLGREVTGNLRTGVLGAALFGAIPALWSLNTLGHSDGIAILATTVVMWAGVVAWNAGTTRSMGLLGLAVAGAGATRAMALVVAVAIAAVVFGHQLLRHRARESSPRRWQARVRRDAALIAIPPLVLSAWWYVRTWIRFGDPTGSAVLYDRLRRQPRPGGITAQLVDLDMWQRMITRLTANSYFPNPIREQVRLAPWAVWATGLVTLVALAGLLRPPSESIAHNNQRDYQGPTPADSTRPELRGWPVLAVAVFGVMVGVAGHTSGGGAPHGRYLLLAMPVLCLVTVIGLERVNHHLPVLAVAAATAASLWTLRASTQWIDEVRVELDLDRFGAPALSVAGAVIAVTGIALAVVMAILASRRPREPARV